MNANLSTATTSLKTHPQLPNDPPPEEAEVEVDTEPINILIVDDESKNLTVLETLLDDPSYRLIRADSADAALLALVVEEFALIILDIRMPGMTGFELAQMIKNRKKTARVPIIFLTAYYNEDQHVLEGYGKGAVDYLHKPVNATVLRSKVAVFADLHRKSRQVMRTNKALQLLNDTLEQRVTERTEALRESDRRKDDFLATLAHELRNPLAPVRNAVEILHLKGGEIPELQWAKDVIDRQMRSMTRLIDDLMDVSRISRGKIELRKEPIELERVLQEAIETSRPLIEKRGHELIVQVPPASMPIHGDLTRLSQVFLNLLNNAAKFTAEGGRIDLTAMRQDNEVTVSIKDTGIGIAPHHLDSVFEMFSQVEGALSRSQGGLGIGLCLVKRLVEMHGGRVEVRSDGLNRGSEFLVHLPIFTEATSANKAREEIDSDAMPKSSFRILVVDDNRDAAHSLAMLLEYMGNTVDLAYDGEEAVAMADKHRPDVVLFDIGLPKLSGYDAARAIRKETWGQNVCLIAVTGWGQDGDLRKSKEAGFNQHLVKPVDPRLLMELLSKMKDG